MATIVEPGSGRLRAEAPELAKHYGVTALASRLAPGALAEPELPTLASYAELVASR
jgi:hypothetical protein